MKFSHQSFISSAFPHFTVLALRQPSPIHLTTHLPQVLYASSIVLLYIRELLKYWYIEY